MSTKRTVARDEAWRLWADHHAHGLCRPGFDAGFEAGVKWQADQERTLGELAKELAEMLELGDPPSPQYDGGAWQRVHTAVLAKARLVGLLGGPDTAR